MSLVTFPGGSPAEEILAVFRRDGACILSGMLDQAVLDDTVSELDHFIRATPQGGDEFTGTSTRRTGALVARSPACRDIVMDSGILELAQSFLGPFTEKIVLHLTQTINIEPGESKQVLHRDRLAWGSYLPREIEPQFNTIWALTDFTSDNGATQVVPGSNHWDWERKAKDDEVVQAEMEAGSVLLYSGSVIHSGAANRSNARRLGLNITYCLGWLRQEENQYLSCPPSVAKDLSPELQSLLGYTMGGYALGYYSDPAPGAERVGILPPEAALGRTAHSTLITGE